MSVLRINTLLVTIKPHSTFQKYFRGSDLRADLNSYIEVMDYIRGLHPDFTSYIQNQAQNGLQESFTILDRNLHELTPDELYMRKPHKNDVLYIVPAIIGGGGKRGLLALIAAAALLFFAPQLLAMGGFGGGSAATVASTKVLFGLTTVGTLTSTLGLNLALMGISMLLMPKPKEAESSRDNDAFGSLVNTTSSGTPVALHYGLVRVGGQLISGYTKTISTVPGDDTPKISEVTSI